MKPRILLVSALVLSSLLPACNTVSDAYYGAAETVFGKQKRDILVSRVDSARKAQESSKTQFASALQEFQSVVKFSGGELEEKYNKLNSAYERSKQSAANVRSRNDDVDNVGRALFREWESELKQYTNPSLKASSQQQMQQTRSRFDQMMAAMRRAEGSIDPVLRTFNDQVLYLKHNLNAQAIGSLQNELRSVEANTAALIREMNASIAEAEKFIATMR